LGGIEHKIQNELVTVEKSCLDASKNDVERFVLCMADSTKRIEK